MNDLPFATFPFDPPRRPVDFDPWFDSPGWDRRIVMATWGFVALGIVLRLIRYAMDFPLWGDEAFVAVNFLHRGYRDLIRPLAYGQICPLFFLWIERAVVSVFGFNELSLRLFPLICGVLSMPLFYRMASRLLRGVPLLLAVGIFAVTLHPIRHAAEVKPYASDLLAALGLLIPALEWWRERERSVWLWTLVGLSPVMLGLSHPAAFVAGGVALGLVVPVWKTGRWSARVPFVLFLASTGSAFLILYVLFTAAQGQGIVLQGLRAYWAGSFPPLTSPWKLLGWLVSIHTGTMFAYPWGGGRGSSGLTTLLFVLGAFYLWRQGWRAPLAILLGPFALTLVAAALRRYPYGGEARQMQFVAPAICVLAAVGASVLLRAIPRAGMRGTLVGIASLLLVLTGADTVRRDLEAPYRFLYDQQVRDFARRFWPEQSSQAELICLGWDYGIRERNAPNLRTAVYLCNQAIYSPQRRRGGPRLDAVSAEHPLRCVLYHEIRRDNPAVQALLARMESQYALRRTEQIELDTSGAKAGPTTERLIVFEFVPRLSGTAARPLGSTIAR